MENGLMGKGANNATVPEAGRAEATVPEAERSGAGDLVNFLLAAGAMKNLPRTGWRLAGIKDCESVADHSFRVVLIALLLAELVEDVDRDKLLRMAVLHELPESLVTDLPLKAVQIVGRDVKQRAERDAWAHLLPPGQLLNEWRALWEEFEDGQTREAKLARIADKLEMLLQAYEYERTGYRNLDNFWSDGNLEDYGLEPIQAILAELLHRRTELGRE
jgi:putative hydrolase of HD superfamily